MSKHHKLENKDRIKEIDIIKCLTKAGIKNGDNLCDYGAGTGIITVDAASMTHGKVYALDHSQDMLDLIKEKIVEQDIYNIETIKIASNEISLPDKSIDIFYMVTVLHHIDNVPTFVQNIKKVLTDKGKVVIIEFYKKESQSGPPIGHRMSEKEIGNYFAPVNMHIKVEESLGENLYLMVLE